jgi:hypothetical protein
MTTVGLRVVAPGTSKFRNEDIAMAVPNILQITIEYHINTEKLTI